MQTYTINPLPWVDVPAGKRAETSIGYYLVSLDPYGKAFFTIQNGSHGTCESISHGLKICEDAHMVRVKAMLTPVV